VATGLLTAALAVAAHGAGGGVPPTGSVVVLLAVLAATIGAFAAARPGHAELIGLLAVGQILGHVIFSAAGHHPADALSPMTMFVAHAVAICAGAALIAVGDRLWQALSRAVRAVVRLVWPVPAATAAGVTRADQPLRSALQLAASVSHRGPPVSLAR
jgi:hypothetical protein